MANSEIDGWLTTCRQIALDAGEQVMTYFGHDVPIYHKNADGRDLVTDADLTIDTFISEALQEAFPDHAILTEESVETHGTGGEAPTWIVDPIDGTSNFTHHIPLFSISIALRYGGASRVGVVHAPAIGLTFEAAEGRGARMNGTPIQVSRRDEIRTAIVGCDWARVPELRQLALTSHTAFAEQAHTMRSFGSAALGFAAVAAGWLDLYFNYSLYPWDVAAGELIVQEAGGTVTTLDGRPWDYAERSVLVSNDRLHSQALSVVAPNLPR